MNHSKTLPVLSTKRRPCSASVSGSTPSNSSSPLHQATQNNSCSNRIFPSRLPLKQIKPEPWQRFFAGEKQQVHAQQGLTLKKNQHSIDVTINEEFFNTPDQRSNLDEAPQLSRHASLPAPIQAHIEHLRVQVNDLALQLAEERLNHKQTRIQGEQTLEKHSENLNKQCQELLQHRMLEQEKTLAEIHEKHLAALNEEQTQSRQREEQLKDQLDFVKNSFHSYKMNLEKDCAEKLQTNIDQALENMRKEFRDKEEGMKKKFNESIAKERKHLSGRQTMELDQLRKQHEKEIDIIHKTFANTNFDRSRTETLSKDLIATKLELGEEQQRTTNLTARLKDLQSELAEATRELNEFRTRFDEKTKHVEQLYAGRIDQLYLQNIDLRNTFMKKCAELIDERALTERKIAQQAQWTRHQLQRKILDVRLASTVPLNSDKEVRRLSTFATASQSRYSSSRCHSAFATREHVPAIHHPTPAIDHDTNDFTLHNQRRQIKLRRRTSVPVTEEERDIVRYLTSIVSDPLDESQSSKFNFQDESTMIRNLTLNDLQQTFRSCV